MTRARDLSKFANNQALSIDSDFDVGINSTAPAAKLDVRGDAVITGVLTATSFSGTVDATGLTGTPDITVNNIVGAAATFSGVVTYEDVTNVDSVGVVTARQGIDIQGGIGATFADDVKAFFGTGGDLEIYHDGSNSRIVDSGTGQLILQSNQFRLLNAAGSENLIDANENGAVTLYYNASTKLETTATGVSVTGDVDIADKIIHTGDTNTAIRFPQADTFSVETGGTEAYRVDSSRRILLGHTSSRAIGHASGDGKLQIEGTNLGTSELSIVRNSDNNGAAHIFIGKSRGSSVGDSTVVQDDDTLGIIGFAGADGTDLQTRAAQIECAVDGTPGGNDMPGRLVFSTTADGASSVTERLRIDSSGNVIIGATDAESFKFKVTNGAGLLGRFTDGTSQTLDIRQATGGIELQNPNNGFVSIKGSSAERLRIDSSGNHILGHTSAIGNMKFGGSGDFGSHSYVVGANKGFANGLAILNYDASASIPAILKFATSRNDTAGSNTIVGNSDTVGGIQFMGNDGTRFIDVARIDAVTDGTVGSNDMPGRLSFLITADGASVVTERMRISKNGEQQHFGTTATNLNIANSASAGNSHEFLYCQHSSTGLATGTNSFRVATDGDVFNTNNSYGSLSDQRLKENIVDATSQWDDIKGLQVRKYNFRENTGHETHTQLGLIAQEVESVSPGLVETSAVKEGETVLDADGNQLESIKSINYSVLYMKAVKALQEAMTRIETLETKVAALESE